MKKFVLTLLFLVVLVFRYQPLHAQLTTEQAYAIDWMKALVYENHETLFSVAAFSSDYTIPTLHGFSGSETTSQGWVLKNFRLTFATGLKFAFPILNAERTYRTLNKALDVQGPNDFIEDRVQELTQNPGNSLRIARRGIAGFVPFFSFSFGRIGINKRNNPISNLLFTFQYAGNLFLDSLKDTLVSQPLKLNYKNDISIVNIAFQYAFFQADWLKFQLLTGLSYSRSRSTLSFGDHNDDQAIKVPINQQTYTDATTDYYIRQINGEASVTSLKHTTYLLHLGVRTEFDLNLFGIFIQTKLLFKLFDDYYGFTDLKYYISDGTGAGDRLLALQSRISHNYSSSVKVVPTFLIGFRLFRVINLSLEVSIFQDSSFVNSAGAAFSIDVAL